MSEKTVKSSAAKLKANAKYDAKAYEKKILRLC